MREFYINTNPPLRKGDQTVRTGRGDIRVDLTPDDVEDLNEGRSITTLTTQGEEIALYPEGR